MSVRLLPSLRAFHFCLDFQPRLLNRPHLHTLKAHYQHNSKQLTAPAPPRSPRYQGRPTNTEHLISPRIPPATMETVHFDTQGDVRFIVIGEEKQLGYVVNSSILRLASPVSAALVGPHFAEGARLRQRAAGD